MNNLSIGTVKNTVIELHWSLLIYMATIMLAMGFKGGLMGVFIGFITMSFLYFIVICHEFGHIFAARCYGIQCPRIVMSVIGGCALLEDVPCDPKKEFFITICGPLVNLGFAFLGIFIYPHIPVTWHDTVNYIITMNLTLMLFNFLPAIPMDGGRIVRALLAFVLPYKRANVIAAIIGVFTCVAMIVFGLLRGDFIFAFIGAVMILGAMQEVARVRSMPEPDPPEGPRNIAL